MQAEAGWASLTGEPSGPPARSGLPIADYAGLVAACGLLAGIVDARRTGRGRDLDTSLFDTALAMLSYQATWWLSAGIETRRLPSSAHPSIVPFQFFATADGYIAVACAKEKFFQALSQAIGMPELAKDPASARSPLVTSIGTIWSSSSPSDFASERPPTGWIACAARCRVRRRELADALEVEGLQKRGMLASYEHALLGRVSSVGLPLRVSESYRATARRLPSVRTRRTSCRNSAMTTQPWRTGGRGCVRP